VKGQRSSIFHSQCKIQDKVCKIIICADSLTNAISFDLVAALSLSMRRLPTPCYMQWMNQSGMLKITHKARVTFSIGNYIDTVDYDVAPLSACHLLLGNPWQFDLDATHGGHSNSYSFMHKRIQHVLKPMIESAIKAEAFVPIKKKFHAATIKRKPGMALIQGVENDVVVSGLKFPAKVMRQLAGIQMIAPLKLDPLMLFWLRTMVIFYLMLLPRHVCSLVANSRPTTRTWL
jgi:hypothetical protein